MNRFSRLHPQLASAHRLFGARERHPAWHRITAALAGSPAHRFHRALCHVLEPWARHLAPDSEFASLVFFVILIALTFLI